MPVTKVRSRWESGSLVFTEEGGARLLLPNVVYQVRKRVAAADINAGATLLPALEGFRYRIVDAMLIAIGGNAAGATTVDVNGTQGESGVTLLSAPIAGLTQSTIVRPQAPSGDGVNGAILADGTSFAACDEGTAITVGKTGSDLTTATHIDVLLSYVIEAAE